MSLPNWLQNEWVVAHKSSKEEIAGLVRLVERELQISKIAGLSNDWRLGIAYNAALQAATAALAAAGYRLPRLNPSSNGLTVCQGIRQTTFAN
jgi:hypothetical protein